MKKIVVLALCSVPFVAMADDSRWGGFYLGANAGVVQGKTDWSDIVVPDDTDQNYPSSFAKYNLNGLEGGVQ